MKRAAVWAEAGNKGSDIVGKQRKLSLIEIERFAIHDGPGIRSAVFLQGCPLHCPWCANPESQTIGRKLLYYEKKCIRCGKCVSLCPQKAMELREGALYVHREHCDCCEVCKKECIQNAIDFSGIQMPIEQIAEVVVRDHDYYEESGGGVTVSGGECFFQFDGFLELLQRFQREKLHVAVETCGQTSLDNIRKAEPYIDLFLFDVKHTDEEIFRRVTGGKLKEILKNLRYLAKKCPDKVVVRVPVIPGFNKKHHAMETLFLLVKELGLERTDLLPYHTFGISKYEQLGIPYKMKARESMEDQALEVYRQMGKRMGLNITIGGS